MNKKLVLAGYEKNHDKGNDRLYAHEAGNRNNCFVIINNGDGMVRWGLPRFEVCTCSRPFAEPCSPVSGDWQLVTEMGNDIGVFFHDLSRDNQTKSLNTEIKSATVEKSSGLER